MNELEENKEHPEAGLTGQAELPSFIERHNIHPFLFAGIVLVIIFVLYQFGGGVIIFLAAGSASVTRENVQIVRLLTMVGQILFLLLPTIFFARLLSRNQHSVFPSRLPKFRETFAALVALFSLQRIGEVYLFFQDFIPIPKQLHDLLEPIKKMMETLTTTLIHAETIPELLWVVFIVAVIPAIAEEMLFRGLIQSTCSKVLSPIAAAVCSGVIFGLYHMNPFELVPLAAFGIFFGMLRHYSGSLFVPMTAHFFNNSLAVLAAYFGLDNDAALDAAQVTPTISTELFQLAVFFTFFVWSFTSYLRFTREAGVEH